MRLDVLRKSDDVRIDVALKISGKSVTVRHHDSMAYGGLLRQNLAKTLLELACQPRVTLVAFILAPTGGKDIPLATHSCQLCITVYGMQGLGRYVGEISDDAGIYLQHPSSYDPAVPYINPHYLVRPGGSHPAPVSEEHVELSIRPSISLSTDQQLKGDVLKMIDSSAQGPSSYSRVTPTSQMRTTLKP